MGALLSEQPGTHPFLGSSSGAHLPGAHLPGPGGGAAAAAAAVDNNQKQQQHHSAWRPDRQASGCDPCPQHQGRWDKEQHSPTNVRKTTKAAMSHSDWNSCRLLSLHSTSSADAWSCCFSSSAESPISATCPRAPEGHLSPGLSQARPYSLTLP